MCVEGCSCLIRAPPCGVGGPSSGAPPWQAASSSPRLMKLFWRGCGGWITEQSAGGCDGRQPPASTLAPGALERPVSPGLSLSAELQRARLPWPGHLPVSGRGLSSCSRPGAHTTALPVRKGPAVGPAEGSKLRLPSGSPRPLPGYPTSLPWGTAGLVFQRSCESETAGDQPSPCRPEPAPLQEGCAPGSPVPSDRREARAARPTHEPGRGEYAAPAIGPVADVVAGPLHATPRVHMWPLPQRGLGRMASVPSPGLGFPFRRAVVMIPTLQGGWEVSV